MSDKARFEKLIQSVLEHEGGYVNDATDPGGETKYGISKRAYPNEDIKNLTLDRAKDIYYRDYWLKLKGPSIQSDSVAGKLLDMGVNLGLGQSVKLLQRAIKEVGVAIDVDGIIGPKTIAAVNGIGPDVLMPKLRLAHEAYYLSLVERKPKLSKYINGWLKRARA